MRKKFKIGIDYGGTKIEGILLDDNGAQIERKRYSYEWLQECQYKHCHLYP